MTDNKNNKTAKKVVKVTAVLLLLLLCISFASANKQSPAVEVLASELQSEITISDSLTPLASGSDSVLPERLDAPELPEEPEVIEQPEVTEKPVVTEQPEVTEEPEAPEVPEEPEVPEAPEEPEEPEVPEAPEEPEEPVVPEEPEAPEAPEAPETPEVPEVPEVPEAPEEPEQPEVPVAPLYERAIAIIKAALNDTEGEIYGYFSVRGKGTSLDSTGKNFAPYLNALLKNGLSDLGAYSYRIWKDSDGSYNIFWTNNAVADMEVGAVLANVVRYNTLTGEYVMGTSVVTSKVVEGSTLHLISGGDFTALVAE